MPWNTWNRNTPTTASIHTDEKWSVGNNCLNRYWMQSCWFGHVALMRPSLYSYIKMKLHSTEGQEEHLTRMRGLIRVRPEEREWERCIDTMSQLNQFLPNCSIRDSGTRVHSVFALLPITSSELFVWFHIQQKPNLVVQTQNLRFFTSGHVLLILNMKANCQLC